jgi:hypothetical protein
MERIFIYMFQDKFRLVGLVIQSEIFVCSVETSTKIAIGFWLNQLCDLLPVISNGILANQIHALGDAIEFNCASTYSR